MADELPIPKSRTESYLAKAAGEDVTIPDEPRSRLEQYLNAIAENGGGGGGGTNNFNQLTNRPKYNGTTMTGSTNIPEVKTYTAGTNVSISGTTISATDTTYSNFTGTDGTATGTAGLVPAPATTDAGKFLKADGTWDTAGGGSSYTAGDGIDITNAVISATNTGKAKELTTDDFNYPTDNPTSVALWLLEPGIYYRNPTSGQFTVRASTSTAFAYTDAQERNLYIVMPSGNSARLNLYVFGNGGLSNNVPYMIDIFHVDKSDGTQYSVYYALDNSSVKDDLTTTNTNYVLSAKQGKVLKDLVDSIAIRASGAPTTSTVGSVGTLYEDTTNGKLYQCTDTIGGSYTWVEVGAGGGSGPTVVQSAGVSTTDVMSQNAVTSMVFADPATQYKIKIGAGTSTSEGNDGIEIGHNASATKLNSTAMGVSASATGARSTAIGQAANAQADDSVVLGAGTVQTRSASSIAVGDTAVVKSNAPGSVALGAYSSTTAQGEMNIGLPGGGTLQHTAYGYNGSEYRLLSGLYDPQSAHDAATKGYVDPTTDSSAPTTATVGRLGQIFIDTTNAAAYMCVAVDDVTPSYTWRQITS